MLPIAPLPQIPAPPKPIRYTLSNLPPGWKRILNQPFYHYSSTFGKGAKETSKQMEARLDKEGIPCTRHKKGMHNVVEVEDFRMECVFYRLY